MFLSYKVIIQYFLFFFLIPSFSFPFFCAERKEDAALHNVVTGQVKKSRAAMFGLTALKHGLGTGDGIAAQPNVVTPVYGSSQGQKGHGQSKGGAVLGKALATHGSRSQHPQQDKYQTSKLPSFLQLKKIRAAMPG